MNRSFFIFQRDSMQCGIACLAMICNLLGKSTTVDTLKNKCFATTEGVSMKGICDAAHELGLETTPGKVSIDFLIQENLPCILHWNQNHFVVLYKVKKENIFILRIQAKEYVNIPNLSYKNIGFRQIMMDLQKELHYFSRLLNNFNPLN